jgi:hypothetical protein
MDYKISRSARACTGCGASFGEGAEYFAAIFEGKEEFERKEFCASCWEADAGRAAAAECYSHWHAHVPTKDDESRRTLDIEAAADFFRRLAGSEEPHKCNFAYLLALLLMRKKILLLIDTLHEQDREYLLVHFRGEDEEYRVEDPKLTLEELERVKDDLGQLLNMDTE